jgi:hypothetical protein
MLRLMKSPLGKSLICRGVFFFCFGCRWSEMGPSEVLAGTPAGTPALRFTAPTPPIDG